MHRLIVFILILFSCNNTPKDKPLAIAFGEELRIENLTEFDQLDLHGQDSLNQLKLLVNDWLMKKIQLHAAKEINQEQNEKIESMVQAYRDELTIHTFEEDFLNRNLDSSISESEMRQYFEKNTQNFQLGSNLVRLLFVKSREENKDLKEIKKLIQSDKKEELEQLSLICQNSCENWYLEPSTWLNFDDVIKEVPIKTYDAIQFLQNNKYVEIKEGPYIYLVSFKEYKIKNSASEFKFEKEKIRKIILFLRQKKILKELENKLKKDAELSKQIERFIE